MDTITKTGTIVSITQTDIKVKIVSCSACNGCRAKEICGMSENADKIVSVTSPAKHSFKVGEEVYLTINTSQGLRAVVFCYVIPLCLLLTAIITASLNEINDFYSGICGIFILIPYYLGVFLLKNKINKKFQFEISKKAHS